MDDQDRGILLSILRTNQHLMVTIASSPDLLPDGMHGLYEMAIGEFVSRSSRLITQVERDWKRKHTALEAVGLTGVHLQLKHAGFSRALARYEKARESEDPKADFIKPLKRVLRWINIVLGSLKAVFPGADFVKEYKDAVEAGVDEAEDEIGRW